MMRKWFQNRKMATKVLLLIIIMIGFIMISESINKQFGFDKYKKELYVHNARILNSYVNYIEAAFDKIEATTYAIACDQYLQDELLFVSHHYKEPGYSKNLKNADARLRSIHAADPYIQLLLLITQTYRFTYGAYYVSNEEIEYYQNQCRNQNGHFQIFAHNGNIVAARELRYSTRLGYQHLGEVAVLVDFSAIINSLRWAFDSSETDLSSIDIAVYMNDECLYQSSDMFNQYANMEDGWTVYDKYFIVKKTSDDMNFSVAIMTGFGNIKRKTSMIYVRSLILSVVTALFCIFLGSFLIKRPIQELEYISTSMDAYGKGLLPDEKEWSPYLRRKDEIGSLSRHFYRMAWDYKNLSDAYYNNEKLMHEMEFTWLQKQIQPHFLYNTLSSLEWMADSNGDNETADMIIILGRMMRSISDTRESIIRVEKDIAIVEDYIMLQKLRYASRLSISIEIQESTKRSFIPKLTLQPLVENSVIHVLDQMLSTCTIRVYDRPSKHGIEIVVEDNGPGFDESEIGLDSAGKGNGIGLKNVKQRLEYAFPGEGGLTFKRLETCMQVIVHIPGLPAESGKEATI